MDWIPKQGYPTAMFEKLAVLLLCFFMIVAPLAGSIWLIATGEARGVEALFLLFSSLVLALVFGICLRIQVKG